MMTDLWFRNADRAMAMCASEGVARLTWTRQHLGRLKMDGISFVRQFYMHTAVRPKIMLIGIQGSSEYDMFGKLSEPKAVYPTWSGSKESWQDLEKLIYEPWGEDKARCEDLSIPSGLRPTYGQKHRIVIHNSPSPISGVAKRFWNSLAQMQSDYPQVEFFVNGLRSFSTLFGLRFPAGDVGLCDLGDINNMIWLPNGKTVEMDRVAGPRARSALNELFAHEDWIRLVGLTPREIFVDQHLRYVFRIRATRWAAKHWADNLRFFREDYNIAPDQALLADEEFVPQQGKRIVLRPKQFTLQEADKILCNRCRIQVGCRFYRADSICGLVDSPMADLEKYFDSRNAGRIIDGLSKIVQMQARRAEELISQESKGTEINPDVDKALNSVFANGVKLAKLVDPNLAGPGAKVQVNIGTGSAASVVSAASPKQMMAQIVEALEMQGIPRERITPDMVAGVLKSMSTNTEQHAIEAAGVTFTQLMGGNQSPPVGNPVVLPIEQWREEQAAKAAALEGEVVSKPKSGRK